MHDKLRDRVLLLSVPPDDPANDFLVLRQGEEEVDEFEAVGRGDRVQDLGHEIPEQRGHYVLQVMVTFPEH